MHGGRDYFEILKNVNDTDDGGRNVVDLNKASLPVSTTRKEGSAEQTYRTAFELSLLEQSVPEPRGAVHSVVAPRRPTSYPLLPLVPFREVSGAD
ncbi:MAG: hypothetical protein O3A00_23170 [Planctomycetota bacterium]|nr:hypothetical protein [Planctomycetota bacterium]